MNILITGGAGFIGSHLSRKLLEEDNKIVVVDNLSQGDIGLIKDLLHKDNFVFVEADIFDAFKMESIFKHNQFDVVFQLVANTKVYKGGYSPLLDIRETLSSTLEVLGYVAKFGIKKFAYLSSSTVYGIMDEVMREATAHLQPISFYGAAKLAGEAFASAYSSMYGIQMWVFRLGNVVGPDATHGIVHDIKEKLSLNKEKIYLLGDGTQAKPFIHVVDAVDGMLYAYKKLNDIFNVIQVGNEEQISMRQVAQIILDELKLDTDVVFSDSSSTWAGDVSRYKYDVTKLKSLGWQPKWTTKEAIRMSVKIK